MKRILTFDIIHRSTFIVCLFAMEQAFAVAGPPYLTDDPDPVPLYHWEAYAFYNRDQTATTDTVNGPAVEINNGIAANTQVHVIVPETYFSQGGTNSKGVGDTEVGIKYRIEAESRSRPEIGVFPLAEIATGEQSRGLGNGRTWFKLPVWLEKNWGPWSSYGGGGYAYNPASGQLNFAYGGLLVQRTLLPSLTLGAEVFLQGAQAASGPPGAVVAGARESSLWNAGGSFSFTPDTSLLFSYGHSFEGDGNSVAYLAIYRTWSPGSP